MRYRDDKGNDYKVTQYMGHDPAKRDLYHVAKIDGHFNAHNAGTEKTNPWTTKDAATNNLLAMAKKKGWKEV